MSEMTRLQSRLLLQPGLKSTTGRIFWGFAIAVFALPLAGQGTSSLSAVAWGNGSAIVSWTTPAVASSQVNYGTSSTALTQKVSSSTLTTNHSVTLSGLTAGATYYYSVTSVDSSGKSTTIPATGQAPMNFVATSSIWGPTATPGTASLYDPSAVELGMKFQSDVAGKVAGIRFYKGPNNIGTHVGHLWSSTGTLLASVTFTNETASGWQQAIFATSVSITAKTEYVISYNAPNGYYAEDENFFASATDVPPLHALQSGTSGGNGVYLYGSGSFPNQTWNACNYWVDVVFVPTNSVAPPPTATSIWPATAVPGTVTDPDSSPVELGLKFQSEVAGEITGVRFYKGLKNTGTHQGHLWSASGLLLATANFTNETASGWQQANFSNPVAIQANTIYVISYYAPASHYSADENYFATAGIYNPPLRALQNGTAGSNGVYLYGSSGFPSLSYYATNYWVDVVFTQSAPAATFGISGTVSPASGGAGASLKLSGAATAAVAADSSGSYTFTGLIDGSYTVTPSKVGYTFSPASASVTVNGANVSGMNFTVTAIPTWSIAGTITGGSGATVTLSGAASAIVAADSSGKYEFTGLANGNYTITPIKTGYTLSPTSTSITVSAANVSSVNFTATAAPTYNIAGTITGGSGAAVTLSGTHSATATADSSGKYTFTGMTNGNYTITPSKTSYAFSPASASVTVNGANVSGVNFTATTIVTFSISGKVRGSSATLTLTGAAAGTTTTDSSGNYSFSGLKNGSYVVTPARSGYTFSPTGASASINGANVGNLNFTATAVAPPVQHSVALSWAASASPNISGYKVYRGTVSGGPYVLISSSLATGTSYTDGTVSSGQTYYYVTTAVDSSNNESGYSNQVSAVIPTP